MYDKISLLADSLEYIENHLDVEIRTEDVARACCCSRSTLEKLYRRLNHITVHEYLVKRRMMKAARALMERSDVGIMEIAVSYGYSTSESFTRAFRQIWNVNPSEFRKQGRYSELYPRCYPPVENGDDIMKNCKHVDISELYDLFMLRKNCCFVCCDIRNLEPLNRRSRKAGDRAILESLNRMNDEAGPEDVVFRIGGDEFVLLTDREEEARACRIAEKIRDRNGEWFSEDGTEFSLNLHVGVVKLQWPSESGSLHYDDLFVKLHHSIREVVKNNPTAHPQP